MTISTAIGSPIIIINNINHFITSSIDLPVTSDRYFNGPSSDALSFDNLVSSILLSILNMLLLSVSVLPFITLCLSIALFNCLSNALRVDDEVVVIICPVSLSLYCITLLDNPPLNSVMFLFIDCFSVFNISNCS